MNAVAVGVRAEDKELLSWVPSIPVGGRCASRGSTAVLEPADWAKEHQW